MYTCMRLRRETAFLQICVAAVSLEITSVCTEESRKEICSLKTRYTSFFQAKAGTHASSVSPHCKASVITAPWGPRLSYFTFNSHGRPTGKGRSRRLQKQTNPEFCSSQQPCLSLGEAVGHTGVGCTALPTLCQDKRCPG